VTEGLDGLRERLAEYREMGARFTKWRAVITIGQATPTQTCIDANAEALARFAALSQEAELVPIVEPETLMDGDHTIDRHYDATRRTLQALFDRLFAHRVELTGTLLKTNMVLSGKSASEQVGVEEVARWTLRLLRECVPPAVPGIVFLSGGQTDQAATAHLSEMNRIGGVPWELSFSYGRALQAPALKAWGGKAETLEAGQRAFYQRARLNSAARSGSYTSDMEHAAA
jgi:fructose-bisphosphate aldolase class I